MLKQFIKECGWLRRPLLYLYHKVKNRHLVKFWYSSDISSRCQFEGKNMICQHTHFVGLLGYGSYIGPSGNVSAEVGRFTSIGPRCSYINATHPFKVPFVTTSPLFFSLDMNKTPDGETFAKRQAFEEFRYWDKEREIVNKIGNDCWIGSDVTLIGGVEISDGAVVLAHAVVTKDVPPYAIVGGIPAKIIGYRYDEETINELLRTKWWEHKEEWFHQHAELLTDIDQFLAYHKNAEKIAFETL